MKPEHATGENASTTSGFGGGFGMEAILAASAAGALPAPLQTGRRARRRAAGQRFQQTGLVASLLAAQGCMTVGRNDIPLEAGAGGNGAPPASPDPVVPTPDIAPPSDANAGQAARDDDHFRVEADGELMIATADLLANDMQGSGEPLEIVRVYDARHGSVRLEGDRVVFTPMAGHEGAAAFKYEVRDGDGVLSEAVVEIQVGGMQHGGHGHDSGGHGGEHGGDHDGEHGSEHGGGDQHGEHGGEHGGGHGEHHHPHPDDPGKASEHMAVLNLVPVAEATHVAVNNGSWFDPATWASGVAPGEGAKVVIPHGVKVEYDGESPASLFTVRVDGMLAFAADADTFMEVDTLIVSPSGHMTIGTVDNPVAPGVEAVIQIADNGPIDVAWDPMLLSRGIVSHGAVDMHGAQKDAFLKVAADPMRGDRSMTLESPPEGWSVGDRIVLTGTRLTGENPVARGEPHDADTQDEELVITRIEGNTVYFDRRLEYDHDTPRADLKAYVANYTRNVRIETENADTVPVHQRGHTMFMHSNDIDVRYAAFSELGRTDKSERAFDVGDLETVSPDANVKGRYALHIHRAGVGDQEDPAMLVGNAVWGSPGWGFVHHDSHAVFTDNAAYDVFGAAYVAETGNETGRWSRNIAIRSIGVNAGLKNAEDVAAFDLARSGIGFWFQGRAVDAIGNVAAGMPAGHGYVYMSRGRNEDVINVISETTHQPEALRYFDDAMINRPPISQFDGNEALAAASGLVVIKASFEQHHDVRSVMEGFTAWEVREGASFQYTGHYTLIDFDIVATDQSAGSAPPKAGILIDVNAIDFVINGANIDGFKTGVDTRKIIVGNDRFDGDFGFAFIDVNFSNVGEEYKNADANDLILTAADLVGGDNPFNVRLEFDPENDRYNPQLFVRGGWTEVNGQKTDSIGVVDYSKDWDPKRYNWFSLRGAVEEEGYWTTADGRAMTVFDMYVADRSTGFLDKVAVPFLLEENPGFTLDDKVYNGVFDPDSKGPVARSDFATVQENGSVVIDVLSNDFDPEGDALNIDGFIHASNGRVYDNEDGTVTYIPDPNFIGEDVFCYWVEDENGNFAMGQVQVTVEV